MKWYPVYKDSGVKWIGEVPEHWDVKRLKHLSSVNDETLSETTKPDYEISYVDISSVNMMRGIIKKEEMLFRDAPSRARRKVQDGDVIVSTVRTYLCAITPIISPEPNMIVSTGFAVVRPRTGFESDFASYALRAPYFVDTVVANSVGVSYPAINASEMTGIQIIVPPIEEQTKAATYLDHKTRLIDTLIEKKQKLVELLQEQRTALISHAVTKGLNPKAKMKDTGIEWLGKVPEHWGIKRLKHVAQIITGNTPPKDDEKNYEEGEFLWVKPNELYEFNPTNDTKEKLTDKGKKLSRNIPPFGVFVNGIGNIGGFGFSEKEVSTNQQINSVVFTEKCRSRYGLYLISAMKEEFQKHSEKVVVPILNKTRQENIKIVLPPSEEQKLIEAHLDHKTHMIDTQIEKIKKQIELYKEYRTTLISDVVTGKIDVRDEVIP